LLVSWQSEEKTDSLLPWRNHDPCGQESLETVVHDGHLYATEINKQSKFYQTITQT